MSRIEIIQLGCVLVFLLVAIVGSRVGYSLHLRWYVNSLLRRLGHSKEELTFSFDKMVYAIPLPTNQPELLEAGIEQYRIVEEYDSWVYPQLIGIRVMLRTTKGTDRLVAYISADTLWIPLLEKLLVEGKIDRKTYGKISTYKLMLPSTQSDTLTEAFGQMRKKKFT
ncbi:hypothetical protein [Cohnella yongneupensis]|uniref:Uncharacterized protein n=1 Tax=Cohnella yongneupensis TaxID=425006 RepID=A0ABW0R3B7_9BACL